MRSRSYAFDCYPHASVGAEGCWLRVDDRPARAVNESATTEWLPQGDDEGDLAVALAGHGPARLLAVDGERHDDVGTPERDRRAEDSSRHATIAREALYLCREAPRRGG